MPLLRGASSALATACGAPSARAAARRESSADAAELPATRDKFSARVAESAETCVAPSARVAKLVSARAPTSARVVELAAACVAISARAPETTEAGRASPARVATCSNRASRAPELGDSVVGVPLSPRATEGRPFAAMLQTGRSSRRAPAVRASVAPAAVRTSGASCPDASVARTAVSGVFAPAPVPCPAAATTCSAPIDKSGCVLSTAAPVLFAAAWAEVCVSTRGIETGRVADSRVTPSAPALALADAAAVRAGAASWLMPAGGMSGSITVTVNARVSALLDVACASLDPAVTPGAAASAPASAPSGDVLAAGSTPGSVPAEGSHTAGEAHHPGMRSRVRATGGGAAMANTAGSESSPSGSCSRGAAASSSVSAEPPLWPVLLRAAPFAASPCAEGISPSPVSPSAASIN